MSGVQPSFQTALTHCTARMHAHTHTHTHTPTHVRTYTHTLRKTSCFTQILISDTFIRELRAVRSPLTYIPSLFTWKINTYYLYLNYKFKKIHIAVKICTNMLENSL